MRPADRLVLRLDKVAKSTGEAPVCLRITLNRKVTYKTLCKIRPEFWDKSRMQVKKAHPSATTLNILIAKKRANILERINQLQLTEELYDVSTIRNKLHERDSYDLFGYADQFLEKVYSRKYATYKTYRSVITKLRNYIGKDSLPVNEINSAFIRKYQEYLENGLENSRNTAIKNLKILSSFMSGLYRENDMEYTGKPFAKCQFKKRKNRTRFSRRRRVETHRGFQM